MERSAGRRQIEGTRVGAGVRLLTVHCVKLVMISILMPCPVVWSEAQEDLEAGCLCQGGKSLLRWGGKHYSQLYRHGLL